MIKRYAFSRAHTLFWSLSIVTLQQRDAATRGVSIINRKLPQHRIRYISTLFTKFFDRHTVPAAHVLTMKSTTSIVALSAAVLLLSSPVESFSTSSIPQQHTRTTELFRSSPPEFASNNGLQIPQQRTAAIRSKTSLSAAPAVGAVAGVLTGGILGGALHAIAGKLLGSRRTEGQTST